ncbi:MAG: thiamine phosphate synthase, partial [Actinobacteria bacterium]|nr:thiamine phosphate synthase [Actinomycetota bacterium]
MNRRERLARAQLYVCVGIRDNMRAFLDAVLGAGVDVVQLRDKDASASEQMRAAELFCEAADRYDALFVMNDRVDLALASGADGVHVGQDDLHPGAVRALVGEDLIIGRSTHSAGELARAADEPVDYVGAGPVNATPTKPGRPGVGLAYVRHAATHATKPWFVTGGVSPGTIGPMID